MIAAIRVRLSLSLSLSVSLSVSLTHTPVNSLFSFLVVIDYKESLFLYDVKMLGNRFTLIVFHLCNHKYFQTHTH
jgi:hypothetical protein